MYLCRDQYTPNYIVHIAHRSAVTSWWLYAAIAVGVLFLLAASFLVFKSKGKVGHVMFYVAPVTLAVLCVVVKHTLHPNETLFWGVTAVALCFLILVSISGDIKRSPRAER